MPGQLEDPQDAHDAEYLGDAPHLHLAEALVLARTSWRGKIGVRISWCDEVWILPERDIESRRDMK